MHRAAAGGLSNSTGKAAHLVEHRHCLLLCTAGLALHLVMAFITEMEPLRHKSTCRTKTL